ncbi:MAG: hypothetical protein N2691_03855 [Patescibacteria group bacterium]|nr:hypothetical protein [Patescibacteria group bacterium]
MKKYSILHAGLGNVGSEFARMVFDRQDHLAMHYGIQLEYRGVFGTNRGLYREGGLSRAELESFQQRAKPLSVLEYLSKADEHTIFVDTTASDDTLRYMITVLERGGYVVMSNKKPLTGSYETYYDLMVNYPGKVLYETTVAAGLPVLRPLKLLTVAGDRITRVEGCFSGTLGFLCSRLEQGVPYGKAVREAKALGFTEPDPRDDLSGIDVARKALILSRLMGYRYELSDIQVEPFFNPAQADLPVEEFMKALDNEDDTYRRRFDTASTAGNTFRYIASVTAGGITVALTEVPKSSPLGMLQGPENKVVITSEYYRDYPMSISGPGAGKEVTAAGVFGDVLSVFLPS